MEAPWLFWLLLLGCPGYPTASVESIFGNFTKDLIKVFHGYINQDLCCPFNLVEYLPDDFRPDPDFYGLPRKPVIIAAYLGIASLVIFIWSSVLAVKPQIYQVNLQQILLKIKDCMEENAKLPEKISNLEMKINESKKRIQETKRNNNILSDEVNKFKVNIETLEGRNEKLGDILVWTRATLQSERLQNANNQVLILEQEKVIANLKGFILKTASAMNEVQNALHEAKIIEAKAKREDEQVWKENAQLKAQEEQLQQEIERQRKEYSALQEQAIVLEKTQKDLEGAQSEKDNNIAALSDCISQLSVSESAIEDKHTDMNGELAGDMNSKMKLQMIQMMDISQAKTAISAAEDDLKQLKLQLSTSLSTNCKLQEHKKDLEEDCYLSRAVKAAEEAECKTLRLKVEILEKMFEPKRRAAEEKLELSVHERNECQLRLLEEEEKAKVVAEEVKYYMQRIEEMEQKLQQTENSLRQQVALHEEKAHDSWLRVRALKRAWVEQTREAAYLKHRLEIAQNNKTVVLERPYVEDPPQRDPGPGPAPLRSSSSSGSSVPAGWTEEGKQTPLQRPEGGSSPGRAPLEMIPEAVNTATRGPPPFTGLPFMHDPIGGPPPPMLRHEPPPPPSEPLGPSPPPLPHYLDDDIV